MRPKSQTIGHQLVNADCKRFSPTNVVSPSQYGLWNHANVTLTSTTVPATKRKPLSMVMADLLLVRRHPSHGRLLVGWRWEGSYLPHIRPTCSRWKFRTRAKPSGSVQSITEKLQSESQTLSCSYSEKKCGRMNHPQGVNG
jgi:hypothetical protein